MAWMQHLRVYTLCRLADLPVAVLWLARASAAEYYGYDQGGATSPHSTRSLQGMSVS